jgi:hypothetical protein
MVVISEKLTGTGNYCDHINEFLFSCLLKIKIIGSLCSIHRLYINGPLRRFLFWPVALSYDLF